MPLLTPLLTVAIVIIVMERLLWVLFRRRMAPLDFPQDIDWSQAHFFSFRKLKILAVLHCIVLLAVTILAILFLW